MKRYLSRHAKNRMRKFRVDQDEIRQVLEKPDSVESSIKGRKSAWKKIGNRCFRVIYVEETLRLIVITVTLKDKLPERSKDEN